VEKLTVGQLEAKELSLGSISTASIKGMEEIELAGVIEAIEKASRHGVESVAQGFDDLKSAIKAEYSRSNDGDNIQKKAILTQENPTSVSSLGTATAKEATNPQEIAEKKRETSTKKDKGSEPVAKKEIPQNELELVEVPTNKVKSPTVKPVTDAPKKAVEAKQSATVVTSGIAPLMTDEATSKFKKGLDGRLRNEKGAFASKAEEKQFNKANGSNSDNSPSGDTKEPERQTSILKQILFSTGKLALLGAGGMGRGDGAINNTAGLALGGSYFMAAQEIGQIMGEVKESLSNSGINSFGDAVNKAKESAAKAKDSVIGFGGKAVNLVRAVQMRSTGEVKEKDEASEDKKPSLLSRIFSRAEPKPDEASEGKKPSLLARIKDRYQALSARPDEASEGKKPSLLARIKDRYQALSARPDEASEGKESAAKKTPPVKSSPPWLKSRGNPLFRFFGKLKPVPTKTDEELLKVYKSEAQATDQRHQETIMALGDIKEGIKGISLDGGGGGLLGDMLDFAGDRRKKKKAKKGARARTGGPSNLSRTNELPSRSSRVTHAERRGSAFRSAGRPISSVANAGGASLAGRTMGGAASIGGASVASKPIGGMAKAGGMLGGAAKAGGAVLSKLALPLTIAMAAYDGISGFNDSEGQKKAFNLKEGEEASLGQKSAMAAGSMLSMGGLTELVGFSGEDIAKGLYGLFSDDAPKKDAKPLAKEGEKEKAEAKAISDYPPSGAIPPVIGAYPAAGAVPASAGVASPAAMATVSGAVAMSALKNVDDIEQIESVNKLKEGVAKKEGGNRNPSASFKPQVISNSDPEVVKLLKSIDKKMDSGATKKAGSSAGQPRASIPSDFSDPSHRRQANNLG
jgi:hypothetical protein